MEETAEEGSGQDYVELIELGKQLIAAARLGNVDAAVRLMHYGAPFATDWWGMTALHHAAFHGHLEIANLLVSSGILKDTRSKVDKTPLHLACQEGHTAVAEFLICNGADVNSADMLLMTPLHWAVEMNHLETVKMLLLNGAQPNLTNKFDKTTFDIAASKAYYDIFAALKESAQSNAEPVPDNPIINYEKGKIKTYTSVKGKKTVVNNGSIKSEVPVAKNDEVWELLEQHGIEMLEGEDVNLVAAALGSGQSVYLTEAGRQALSLTRRNRQLTNIPTGATVKPSTVVTNQRQYHVLAAKKGRSSNIITINTSKLNQVNTRVAETQKSRLEASLPSPPHATEMTTISPKKTITKENEPMNEVLVADFYEKFLQAKKDAKHHHTMYLKKRREAEHYLKRLTMTVKSISDSDSDEVKLLNSHLNAEPNSFLDDDDEEEGEGDEEVCDFIDEPLDNL